MSYNVACSHFRPNLWRPTNCAYCYRPKHKHFDKGDQGPTEGAHNTAATASHFMIPRAATISTGSPTSCRERKLCSEPPVEKTENMIIDNDGCSPSSSMMLDDFHKQVGIVKPYAVVELNSITWQQEDERSQFPYSNNTFPAHLPPSIVRQRVGSCNALTFGARCNSNNQPTLTHYTKRSIVPKRKAPPPPGNKSRSNRSSSVPNIVACKIRQPLASIDNSIYTSDDSIKEKSPPNKPPRTQSTFVAPDEIFAKKEESLVKKEVLLSSAMLGATANDYEPLRRIDAGSILSSNNCVPSLLNQIQDVFNNALTNVAKQNFEELTSTENFIVMDWADITVCIDMNDQHQLYYHMQPITLEPFEQAKHSNQLEIAKTVASHLNLSLLRGTLMRTPVDYIDFLPDTDRFVVYHSSSGRTPLEKIIPTWRSTLTDDKYIHCVLMVLVQVLRGLKYLYHNGIVHRDVGLESLTALTYGTECIIKLDSFQYALYRPGPISATTFVFAYHELSWLGGVESHLPPEILDTSSNVNTLDYSHTDSFAVGCLIYELIVGVSPFDTNTQLVYLPYTEKDLPGFSKHSRLMIYLEQLSHLLLYRDPLKRLGVSDALLVVQALLWLPQSWLEHCISIDVIEDHLTYLKATLLAELAQHDNHNLIPLETLLKVDFLASCNPSDLIRTLSVFNKATIV